MKFVLGPVKGPSTAAYPYVELLRNNWDDYGYRTTFNATLHLSANDTRDLGSLKILQLNQRGGDTPIPEGVFDSLGPEYCSLAGRTEYYKLLHSLGPEIFNPYLAGLKDVVANPTVLAMFEDEEGFRASLLRYSGAESLIREAAQYFAATPVLPSADDAGISITFKTQLGAGSTVVCDLDFQPQGGLPSRMIGIIGYNGSGKTVFLSNLAIVTSGYGYEQAHDMVQRSAGRFVGDPPPFKKVIVVSYSAFDTFVIPGRSESERASLQRGDDQLGGYVYCGLRQRDEDGRGYRLRTTSEIEDEFIQAMSRIRLLERTQHLKAIATPLNVETSFLNAGLEPLFAFGTEAELRELFSRLSSGHKIVLKIISALTANIEQQEPTLVLIDEPETHLHPPLLAALLKSVRVCLGQFNGYAVVATHSPIVLQELPSRSIRVLRRQHKQLEVPSPKIETFGEDLSVITQYVFNLDDSSTDWHDTLCQLAKLYSLDEIEKLLGRKLGFAARSYFVSLKEPAISDKGVS